MSIGLRLWLRRGTSTVAFPGMVLCTLVAIYAFGTPYEWDLAFSSIAATTWLIGALVAGCVAFDISRRLEPSLALFARCSPRQVWQVLSVAAAGLLCGLLAWAVGCAVVAVRVALQHPDGSPELWVFAEGVASLLAATAVGCVVGAFVKGTTAGPIAAAVVIAGQLALNAIGFGWVLWAGGATASLAGADVVPQVALATIGFRLLLAVAAAVLVTLAGAGWSQAALVRRAAVALVALMVVGTGVAVDPIASRIHWRWTSDRQVCVGQQIVVCGPVGALATTRIAQRSLAEALPRLESSGLDWPHRFVQMPNLAPPAGDGTLYVSSEEIRNGRLATWDVASALATPVLCSDVITSDRPGGDAAAEQITDARRVVIDWLLVQLDRPGAAAAAPPAVLAAYREVSGCTPFAGRLP